jgi:cell division protease FtsH
MFDKIKDFFQKKETNIFLIIASFLGFLLLLSYFIDKEERVTRISHSAFIYHVKNNEVKSIQCEDEKITGRMRNGRQFEVNAHLTEDIWNSLHKNQVDILIKDKDVSSDSIYLYVILFFIVGVFIWYYFFRGRSGSSDSRGGGISSIFSVGKSRFKKSLPGAIDVRFSDVAGAQNAKDALQDIVDFLKNPEKFQQFGVKAPRGVLLAGEPGNGKTLLARALAGEANCTFITISGSDFIEVFVGVGAARIRDLFYQGRKSSPCIIFIDEIDTIGKARGLGFGGGGHDEREQALNQLLTEMDGFDQSSDKPLVVLGATNMPEVLDKALLRPGRFDRIVYVPYPDSAARRELILLYTKKMLFEEDVDIDSIVSLTQGLSGADINNLVNLAGLKAAQASRSALSADDFDRAIRDIRLSKRDIQIDSQENPKEFLPQQIKTKFSDVAGLEDAKRDLEEVVSFLKSPEAYHDIGAKIPRGVLMEGEPGNGKTLLARALAGEAGVPFFYASGSQFIQKYVGVGAERVRELFLQARKHSPSIVFIDEIDAIGGERREEAKEHNQTINQLLAEMDGFLVNDNPIVVIGATNRVSSIDKALKRPGRFDRVLHIPFPHLEARYKILCLYAKQKKIDDSVDLHKVARATAGFSAAQLEALLNEAAIYAVSKSKKVFDSSDIEEAKDQILVGKKNIGLIRTSEELKNTAYHEAGHALSKILLDDYPFDFLKVTISSRGGTLGVSWGLPRDDSVSYNREELFAKVMVSMAGRAAEVLVFGKFSLGAYGDFSSATDIATKMVRHYGMGERTGVGSFPDNHRLSLETQKIIDEDIRSILDSAYSKVFALLKENHSRLEKVASLLLEKETLSREEVYDAAGIPLPKKKVDVAAHDSLVTEAVDSVSTHSSDDEESSKNTDGEVEGS